MASGVDKYVCARIVKRDNKTLAITEVPFSKTTTTSLSPLCEQMSEGTSRLGSIDDKTARIKQYRNSSPLRSLNDKSTDALYAFTDCEVSISPNCCVIKDEKPEFMTVSDVLKDGRHRTEEYLRQELEIELDEPKERHLVSSLEELFITRRIYK